MPDLRLLRGGADKPLAETSADLSKTAIVTPANDSSVQSGPTQNLETIEPGSTLGHYLIVSKIGEGGMGEVYKAHDTTLDRTVALKVLSPHLFRNQEFLQRFRVEAQAQARLNGPNIVTLHSLFEVSGSLVLVMEFVEGQTLAQRIHNTGRLSVGTSVWVFEQALIGVERAHRMGIVHRDLKPSNIFITNGHEIKLMDFGVAKILDNKELTQTGSMIGTLMYISPEQISGKDADFRSDIYTLGITLYEACTGQLPFEKKTDYEYMDAHLHTPPPRPTSIQPDIPKELEAVILKAIEKDPEKRFQNALEFRSALIKVGMQHVKAYRRLKTMRKDKDRAVLSATTSPHISRADLPPAARSEVRHPSLLTRLSGHRARLIIGATSGLLGVAALALSLGYYLAQKPVPQTALPETAQLPQVASPSNDASTLPPLPAPATDPTPAEPLNATPPTETVAKTPAVETPAVRNTQSPTAPKHRSPARSRQNARNKTPAEGNEAAETDKKAVENKKYDSLRKAWGG
jgi:serine/threonine-protein kinase